MRKLLLLVAAITFLILGILESEYYIANTFVRFICVSCLGLG